MTDRPCVAAQASEGLGPPGPAPDPAMQAVSAPALVPAPAVVGAAPAAPAAVPLPPVPQLATDDSPRRFRLTVFLWIGLGTAFSLWLLHFTDAFKAFAELLALGGLLTWVSFVLKILPKARQEELQKWLNDWCFEWKYCWVWPVVLFGLPLALSLFSGTLELNNVAGGDTAVRTYATSDPGPTDAERLAAGTKVRKLQFVRPLTIKEVYVKASGLPATSFKVHPWWCNFSATQVAIPASLLEPVVLIGAHGKLLDEVGDKKMQLEILVNGNAESRIDFDGNLAFFGCADADLSLPTRLSSLKDWATALAVGRYVTRLFPATAVMPPRELKPHTRVQARLMYHDSEYTVSDVTVIRTPTDPESMIHPILLRPKNP